MVYNQFSYWLDAKPAANAAHTAQELLDALKGSNLARPEGPMIFEIKNGNISGEVEPDWGTVSEDESLKPVVAKIAAQFPDWDFEFREDDEEDHSIGTTTWYSGGAVAREGYIRTVESGEFDAVTIDAIVAYLEASYHHNAAKAIRDKFK